jgi:putative copper export protein
VTAEIGYEWLPKAVVYALVQFAIGLAVARRLARPADGLATLALDARLSLLAVGVAAVLLLALAARVWVHTATAFGWADAWIGENLRVIALESRWGARWQVQMAAAALLAVAALATRRGPAGWAAFAVAAVAIAMSLPLLGHAGGSVWRHGVHAAHLVGSGLWLGTLGVVTTLGLSASSSGAPDAALGRLIARFSPVALSAASMVLLTGVIAAYTYVGSIAALRDSPYGRVLLVKLAVVAVIAACGWRNWQRVRRHQAPARSVMTVEWLAALAAVAVTAVLSETEHP